MAINMTELRTFFWQHFVDFVNANPANEQFPKTEIEVDENGVLTISHPGAKAVGKYGFLLPECQGRLEVNFRLKEEWRHLELEYIQTIHGPSFVDTLLAAYSEHTGEFIAGVPISVEFDDEEWAKIDEARTVTGQTREEFVMSAIEEKLKEMSQLEGINDTFVSKLTERLGKGTTVIRFDDEDAPKMFVVGLPGSEKWVAALANDIRQYGKPNKFEVLTRKVEALVKKARESNVPAFQLFRYEEDNNPFEDESARDQWVEAIDVILIK
tara:strand:- start:1907 stop:2710 length:804 start_codon:yes stop_codon:yes gene_type:complete